MEFRIADTFVDSLARLPADEQKAVKMTAFELQMNPANPGMQMHKLDRARDPNFRSVRVSRDLRLIVHQTQASVMLCYAGHHDDAYRWAERRKLEVHPKTGAAQFVEVRETIQEIAIPTYVVEERPIPAKAPLFAERSEEELLRYGIPKEWLEDVRTVNEDSLLELADHLPAEAVEALLELATGGTPQVAAPPAAGADPYAHPDAQRRFRVMQDVEELKLALEYPWEKWTVFLHPQQLHIVEADYSGPARVSGSAGTGKTIVALHRAVHLARKHEQARVLLTTFSGPLANALRTKLVRLIGDKPRLAERLEVHALNAVGERLFGMIFGPPRLASRSQIEDFIVAAAEKAKEQKFSPLFLVSEWEQVVDAWQLMDWEAYRDVQRLGRKSRLPETQRRVLWSIFENVRESLRGENLISHAEVFTRLADHYRQSGKAPYDFFVVDEAQDLSVAQLRFLGSLCEQGPNALFFTGDLGQRIFQQPFSWNALGVDVRGHSQTLRVNYRTSHQIRAQADRLLDPEISDVDGQTQIRAGTVSAFNGPDPVVRIYPTQGEEIEAVGKWLLDRTAEGVEPREIGIIVRSWDQLERARAASEASQIPYAILDEDLDTTRGHVSLCTMHLAKGLEFRAVAVMACDDEVIPLQARIETVVNDSDLEEVYNTERHLLYVACTRARDHLLVTGVEPGSEFLEDLGA